MRDPEGKPLSRGSIQKLQIDQRCVGADVSYSRRCKVLPTIRNSLFLFEPRSETASLRMIGEITPQPAFVDQRTSPERLVTPGQDSREPQIFRRSFETERAGFGISKSHQGSRGD